MVLELPATDWKLPSSLSDSRTGSGRNDGVEAIEQGTLCTDRSERVPLPQLCLPEVGPSKDRSPVEKL